MKQIQNLLPHTHKYTFCAFIRLGLDSSKRDPGSISYSVQESEGMGGDTQEDMQEKIPMYNVIVLPENQTNVRNGAVEHVHILGDGTRRQAAWTHCKDTVTGVMH